MAIDTGLDLAGVLDLEITMREVEGRELVAQAVARRLTTSRGSLFYDLEYGFDTRAFVNASDLPDRQISTSIENEVLKEETVEAVSINLQRETATNKLAIFVALLDAEGPFQFVLSIDQVTVEILQRSF